ncbi:MAG: hypothetical protein ABR577_13340 [Pyrinomonadaceae bacterium]
MNRHIPRAARCAAVLICALLAQVPVFAHHNPRAIIDRDHLTAEEAELVREEQALNRRTAVFIKAIERRLLVLTDAHAAASKAVQKDSEKWGELPKGTRAELLHDIAKILDEAATNIDDVSQRAAKNPLLPQSLRKLSEASTKFIAQLNAFRTTAKDEDERAALDQAIENAQTIIAAASKLPPDVVKSKKEKGKS